MLKKPAMLKIHIASDHAGFELKEALITFLRERGLDVEDDGPSSLNPEDDYPDYILTMASKVAQNKEAYGIALGASGQGEAMVANRIKGVRAAVYYGPAKQAQKDAEGKTLDILASTREHNDANILSIGARFVSPEEAKEAVLMWLGTAFSGAERHVRRLSKF
jgi:ribose 5-phosphate isomerase B